MAATAERISERLIAIAGEQHTVPVSLGLAPTRVDALLRSLRLLLDSGIRGIGDASLGTTNLIFLCPEKASGLIVLLMTENETIRFRSRGAGSAPTSARTALVYRYFLGTDGDNGDEGNTVDNDPDHPFPAYRQRHTNQIHRFAAP